MRRLLATLASWLLLACAGCALPPAAERHPPSGIQRAEAVRGQWNDASPPATGWVPVTLMDDWTTRWPDHDGVVWYRVRWQQDDVRNPAGLMLEYVIMAGAVYVNGSLVGRDPSLVEPLSRAWTSPQYYLLSPPLLKQGRNELLVRVSGLPAYMPGLGVVTVGDAAQVQAKFDANKFQRHYMRLLDGAIGAVLAVLFGMFWLFRRQDTTYGWLALNGAFTVLFGLNWLKTSPWPFATTDGWQTFVTGCYAMVVATHVLFLLRFADRRWPRSERSLLGLCAGILVLALLMPQELGPLRGLFVLPLVALQYLSSVVFTVWALRRGRTDQKVLGLCVAIPLLQASYDFALASGLLQGRNFLDVFTGPILLLGMGFVLTHRFVAAMRRAEGFNVELKEKVAAATGELSVALNQRHALALAHSRAGERLQLVRDLHDGFGGTLVGAIARLEQAPAAMPKTDVVALLKEMRDDLRLVIDTTAQEQADLASLVAPLRHRASRLLEAVGIEAHWDVTGIDGLQLEPAHSLDLLRLLQEALTNVFKHSRASRVEVRLAGENDRLRLRVADDGVGLSVPAGPRIADGGAGLASMRLRAQRLGGELRIGPGASGTALELELPLPAQCLSVRGTAPASHGQRHAAAKVPA